MTETLKQALEEIKDLAGRIDRTISQNGLPVPPLLLCQATVKADKLRCQLAQLAGKLAASVTRSGKELPR